jgi:hypothetical protein
VLIAGASRSPPTFDRLLGRTYPGHGRAPFKGKPGSLQLWMDGTETLKSLGPKIVERTRDLQKEWNRCAYVKRVFDDSRQRGPQRQQHPGHGGCADDPGRPFPGLPTGGPTPEFIFGPEADESARRQPYLFKTLPRAFVGRSAVSKAAPSARLSGRPHGSGDQAVPPQGPRPAEIDAMIALRKDQVSIERSSEEREIRMNRKSAYFARSGLASRRDRRAIQARRSRGVAEMGEFDGQHHGVEQLSGPAAVTKPELTPKDGIAGSGQGIDGRVGGYIDSWKYEIAAYRMDRILGLNMVPPTVERRFKEERGSLQLWVDSQMSLKKKEDDRIKTPSYKVYPWNLATYLERAFDNLIGNEDRHMNNILITKDWGLYLIDHSRSYRTSRKFTDQLIYRKGGKEGDKLCLLPGVRREDPRADGRPDRTSSRVLTDAEIAARLKRRPDLQKRSA